MDERNISFKADIPLSLYVHVPFCAQKCGYCDFYSRASVQGVEQFIDSLEHELRRFEQFQPELFSIPVQTIFFGGGTPSILTSEQWLQISQMLTSRFTLMPNYEWTIECNPESFSEKKAHSWLESGVNRLSMGVQSLNESVLKKADRIHSAETVHRVLGSSILHDFSSVSCDTIYGLPGQSVEDVTSTIRELLSYNVVKHLSAYELTIAEGTPFAEKDLAYFPGNEVLEEYEFAVLGLMKEFGFKRYEVSNYALPGHECGHNNRYWQLKPYLGLGPSAHSFDGQHRFSNLSSLTAWSHGLKNGEHRFDHFDSLTTEMFRDEWLFLSLRTARGIELEKYETLFGENLYSGSRKSVLEELERRGDLISDNGVVSLTDTGLNLADGVALKLSC